MSTAIITANSGGFDKQTTCAVVFNADDFGLSRACNEGVIVCHERGVVRSTSLMAGGAAFEAAADYARRSQTLDCGLHLALCEAAPVCKPGEIPSLVSGDGKFPPDFATFLKHYFSGRVRKEEVGKEFRAQLEKASAAGIRISHLDSHQHLHALPSIFEIVVRLAVEYKIPAVRVPDERGAPVLAGLIHGRAGRTLQRIGLSAACRLGRRFLKPAGVASTGHFAGFMDMGRWNKDSLCARIESLEPGLTEICCHPRGEAGHYIDEMATLTSHVLKQCLEQQKVRVTSFHEYFTNPPPPDPRA